MPPEYYTHVETECGPSSSRSQEADVWSFGITFHVGKEQHNIMFLVTHYHIVSVVRKTTVWCLGRDWQKSTPKTFQPASEKGVEKRQRDCV